MVGLGPGAGPGDLGPAPAQPYYYAPYRYSPYLYYAPPPVYYSAPPVLYSEPQTPQVEREVVFPTGRYVLAADGVRTAYRWVWVPNPPPPPTAPPDTR